ncbi:hypothetical protein GCM10008904_28820 [Paraclostridium ghonii]|uniref:Ion transporter superfamily protein YfcC n=1 Tax=Paraclostridium ghonii TaxID=29358 RepID=A0ABU0N3C0_9FIRM|nr:putative ion transporter superfamily protein YfcC [Paeniclostridium ghonii]
MKLQHIEACNTNFLIGIITPTGLILASLAMINVTYDKWLKFVMPLVGIIMVLSMALLCVGSFI